MCVINAFKNVMTILIGKYPIVFYLILRILTLMSDFIDFLDLPVLFIKPVSPLFIRIKESYKSLQKSYKSL